MKNNFTKLPRHIGFIIDGNGRWAKERNLPRTMGHKAGIENLMEIIKECQNLGVNIVSIYAFSTENWSRPKEEVDYLMKLFNEHLSKFNSKNFPNARINIMGDISKLSQSIQSKIIKIMDETKSNHEFIINLGINYSGKDELVNAFNSIIKDGITKVDRETIDAYLYTKGQVEPDFIIRTSGEKRLSNFMLWQCAYSELYFPKIYWPSFNKDELYLALSEFEKRNRRYGSL